MMRARIFTHEDTANWDSFCEGCRAATFLHSRRYLSYHGRRLRELSLVLEEKGRWVAVLPAARHPKDETCVVSHPGITYGGVLHQGALGGRKMSAAFECITQFYSEAGYEKLVYKPVPHFYHLVPAQDDLYSLFCLGARRTICNLSTTIDLANRAAVAQRRKRGFKKAQKALLEIGEGIGHAENLWEVVTENLASKHGVNPVHSLEEIRLLGERFPENIRFVVASLEGKVEAGIVLFITKTAYHAQYIASGARGHQVCALDALFEYCIDQALRQGKRWFDFGISTEDEGRFLNEGLHSFKSEFGGGGTVHEIYELPLDRKGRQCR